MATKTNLINAINGFLTAIITQAKVRSAALETINELYPETFHGGSLLLIEYTSTITENTADVKCNLHFRRNGNILHLTGNILNATGNILGNTDVFDFDNTELDCSDLSIIRVVSNGNNSALLSFNGTNCSISEMAIGESYYVNATIFLNN